MAGKSNIKEELKIKLKSNIKSKVYLPKGTWVKITRVASLKNETDLNNISIFEYLKDDLKVGDSLIFSYGDKMCEINNIFQTKKNHFVVYVKNVVYWVQKSKVFPQF